MAIVLSDNYIGYSQVGNDRGLLDGRNANSSSFSPLKNRIINGNFKINQISTTNTAQNQTTRYFPIDRWWTIGSVGGKFTTQIVNDGPSVNTTYFSVRRSAYIYPETGRALNKCVEIKSLAATTLGATDVYAFGQNIEGRHVVDMRFGEAAGPFYFIVSFWFKASQAGTYTLRLQNSAQDRTIHETFSVYTANVWEFQEIPFAVDQSGTWLSDINTGLRLIFNLGVGTSYRGTAALSVWNSTSTELCSSATTVHLVNTLNATMRITGVQLEFIGTGFPTTNMFATAFEERPFQQELDLCRRYFQKSWAYGTNPGVQTTVGMLLHTDMQPSTVQQYLLWKWPVPMRAGPTIEIYGYNNPAVAGYGHVWGTQINSIGDYAATATAQSRYGAMFFITSPPYHTLAGFHFKANAEPA